VSLHEQLYQWTARQRLDAASARRLWQLSGVERSPADLWTLLRRGTGAVAAGLIGFGVILWVAANWETLGRGTRFGLLQALLFTSVAGAATRPAWRAPLGLLSFLALGGVLAYFGQTYQTGADSWCLFALWSGLALPLVIAIRSDLVWTPWVVVAGLAISLWTHTYAGRSWRFDPPTLTVHALGLAATLLLALAMAWRMARTGQPWAWRMAVLSGTVFAAVLAVVALFSRQVQPQFWLCLALLAVGLSLAWWQREVYAMSVLALAVDVLLVARITRGTSFSSLGGLLLIGGAATVLLAGSVHLILRRMRSVEATP